MKKLTLLKTLFLLCALVVGSSSVWADEKSVDITSNQALNGGVDPITIVCAKGDGTDVPKISSGQLRLYQAASGKTTGNTMTFSSEKTITKIVFTFANSMTADNGVFSDGSYDSESSTWTGSTTSVTLTVTGKTSGTRIYITALKVYYENGSSTTPSIDANGVNIAYNATSGEFAYTLNNPVDGAILAASSTDNWISNIAVNTGTEKVTFNTTVNTTTSPRQGKIIVTYTKDDTELATKEVSITQARQPAIAEDGVFDFSYADEIDYGTGLQPSTTDIKTAVTFTAGNVTLTPEPTADKKYWRWYTGNPPTLRLYTNTKMTIAVPDGYRITKIDFTGTQHLNEITVSAGEYEAASNNKSAVWNGCAQSIVFTRDGDNPFFTNITVTYVPSTASVTIPSSGYATLSYGAGLDFASATVTSGDALKAYVIPENNGTTLSLVEKQEAPANEGILLKGTANKTYSIPVKADAAEVGTNLLKAGPTTVPANNETIYLLKSGQFHLASEGTTSAGKAYLELPSAVNARTLTFSFEGETTSINGVEEVAPANMKTRKVVKNGRLVIETANGEFTIDGARMK